MNNNGHLEVFLNPVIGANITYHQLTWTNTVKPTQMRSGGNITYHRLDHKGTELHNHENPEVILTLNGSITHIVNGDPIRVNAGSLIFIRPSDSHKFEPIDAEPVDMLIFAFSLELFLELSEFLKNDVFLKRLISPVSPPLFKLSASEAEKLGQRLLMINESEFYFVEDVKIKIKLLIANLYSSYFLDSKNVLKEKSIPNWLDELCCKMSKLENFSKGLKKMQSICGCTPEHLCKSFRKHLDKSPTQFINELRINHAARLLKDTDEEIFAIASDLGFKSLSRFYHMFKKQYNISPAKYRSEESRSNTII